MASWWQTLSDYIEYPTILSQPESDADELVADAIEQLLAQNESASDNVCISVPGQSGLAKFFKPPPVELKKVADIVRYEARQQIPFDLDEVVWDYQMMPGSIVEEGYALESEVGLFAMKRNQAFSVIEPFEDAGIEVDAVQLAPIALYNMMAHDQLHERVEADVFDPDDPPPSIVLLSIGTDSSDLIVTNGFRIWQRSMPIGGNHFTRQLTKDLKLTFAKAEHLKRNAREAEDPKLIFQTMRPVFNDLVTEVQRSLGFFRSIDKKAEIGEVLLSGNTTKMPGLAAYLGKNLEMDVRVLEKFDRLSGDVTSQPTFTDNASSYGVCYGLCLQGLKQAQLKSSLIPSEIVRDRLIRSKKPWTLVAIAAALIAMAANFGFTEKSWETTRPDLWQTELSQVTTMKQYRDQHESKDGELDAKLQYLNKMGEEVAGNDLGRSKWIELFHVMNSIVPRPKYPDGKIPSNEELPIQQREDFYVASMDTKKMSNVKTWWSAKVEERYKDEMRNWRDITGKEPPAYLDLDRGPAGEAWIVELQCYHYFNVDERVGFKESDHIRKVMTTAFFEDTVRMPIGKDEDGNEVFDDFTMEELGFTYPFLVDDNKPKDFEMRNPDLDLLDVAAPNQPGAPAEKKLKKKLTLKRLDFVFQVVWKPTKLADRLEAKAKKRAAEERAQAAAGAQQAGLAAPAGSVASQ